MRQNQNRLCLPDASFAHVVDTVYFIFYKNLRKPVRSRLRVAVKMTCHPHHKKSKKTDDD